MEGKKVIRIEPLTLPEVVPQVDLQEWKNKIPPIDTRDVPVEVMQFINALAAKLGDFGRIGITREYMRGYDLLLSGMKEVDGEKINSWDMYPIPVPYMVACDHKAAMLRIFKRKGKEGLITWCKVKVDKTELARILDLLDIEVFKQDHIEFKKVLAEINAQKKLDSDLKV